MTHGPDALRTKPPLLVWWIIWTGTLAGLAVVYLFTTRGPAQPLDLPPETTLTGLIGIVPLFVSIVIRWLILPRHREPARAFVLFVLGIAMAESCGILGTFLGGPYREDLFVLGLLGIAQFVPFFAKGLFEPKGSGFIPNN